MSLNKSVFIHAFIVAAVCVMILLVVKLFIQFDTNHVQESSSNISQSDEFYSDIYKKQNMSTLLSDSQRSSLIPRSITNLDRIFGFRGLKMHMNVNEIRFDRIDTSDEYGRSFGGEWEPYKSDIGYTSYFVDISMNSPYSLAGSPIRTFRLIFIDNELAQIVMTFNLYDHDFPLGVATLNESRYNRFLSSLISTFGNPTVPEYSEYRTIYLFNENQDLPAEQVVETEKNKWKTDSIRMILKNELPSIKKIPGITNYAGGSVSLVYRSQKYNNRLDEIYKELEERNRKYYMEENLRRQIGDF